MNSQFMQRSRAEALQTTAKAITALVRPHPVRVAIDGRTAAGKTMLADELAAALEGLGRNTIRTGIDGFHRPRNERYARGRFSPEGYYFDARDLEALRSLLLAPPGSRRHHGLSNVFVRSGC